MLGVAAILVSMLAVRSLFLIAAISVLFLFMGIRNSWDRVNYRTELDTSGSWWCPVETRPTAPGNGDTLEIHSISWRLPVVFAPLKQVFSQDDRDAASHELSELHEKGSTEMFLAPIIFSWAKAHPNDPQVPVALHRLVVVTGYGCRNANAATGQISRAAFDLLHKQYPKNRWTAQTPYWFQ
jgi:hypothetical protein